VVFGYKSATDFHILQVIGEGKVRIIHRASDAWRTVSECDLPHGEAGRDVLSVRKEGQSTSLWANGAKVATLAATGRVGLSADAGRTLFRVTQPGEARLADSSEPARSALSASFARRDLP
jgi:hypothetical protein